MNLDSKLTLTMTNNWLHHHSYTHSNTNTLFSPAYLKICTIFCLITQLSALASALLSGLGIRLKGSKRATCLRFAICTTLVTLLCDICLISIYPTQFAKEIDKSNRSLWELNSAFGLASGAGILTFGTLVLLVAAFARNSYIYESAPTRIWI